MANSRITNNSINQINGIFSFAKNLVMIITNPRIKKIGINILATE